MKLFPSFRLTILDKDALFIKIVGLFAWQVSLFKK